MSPQQKALFLTQKQGKFELGSRSIPSPGTGQLLVKIQSAALNPVDHKIQDTSMFVTNYPAILGTDIAGIVEELGEGVENFRKGDRVLAHGGFTNDLAGFQQYALTVASYTGKVVSYILFQIPSNQSFDSAATVPVGFDTALVGLYGNEFGAGVSPPWTKSAGDHESKKPIVIFGGSSSVGSYVIQLARLSGFYPIIATASPSNEDLVKDYGATHFFDRNLSGKQLMTAISKVTDRPIEVVYDAISAPETQLVAWELLANNGTLIVTVPASVKEDEGKGRKACPYLRNQELWRTSWAMLEKWLSEGTIQPNKYEVLPNGLGGIVGGLERLKLGQVSGRKLVAHPQETQ
ncbi:chaperonin 10-like protein [Suillus subluteus]|nr:chaperonin 10-like protein [Suillus subluteus]